MVPLAARVDKLLSAASIREKTKNRREQAARFSSSPSPWDTDRPVRAASDTLVNDHPSEEKGGNTVQTSSRPVPFNVDRRDKPQKPCRQVDLVLDKLCGLMPAQISKKKKGATAQITINLPAFKWVSGVRLRPKCAICARKKNAWPGGPPGEALPYRRAPAWARADQDKAGLNPPPPCTCSLGRWAAYLQSDGYFHSPSNPGRSCSTTSASAARLLCPRNSAPSPGANSDANAHRGAQLDRPFLM